MWADTFDIKTIEKFGVEEKEIPEPVKLRIKNFADALQRFFNLKIPLIKVSSDIFSPVADENDITDPPLAVLFKRIGTGGTALSDADYVYSVIKHHLPQAHNLVETLHDKHNIAGLLSATNLVMTAVRLAVAEYKVDGKSLTDWESPTKQEFHRLIKNEGFLQNSFLPMIQNNGLESAFSELTDLILYHENNNAYGLPLHAFPLLKRPLIQVLLRLIRCIKNTSEDLNASRSEILRFIMYWQLCVTNSKEASRIAFEQLHDFKGSFSGEEICNELQKKGVAIPIFSPETIKRIKKDVAFSPDIANAI
jgi:hypothetical protein